ncbi:MAG TPA: DinB family protein [Thermoanaerobaculia bacterium]|nr:DinB family protein [Thermoanaerobaculia bacterium]
MKKTEQATLLDEAIEAWGFARDGVIAEIENLSEAEMAFRPAEESRSVAELVEHILESGAMMAGELSRPDGDFRRKSYPALLKEHGRGIPRAKSRRELVAALRKTFRDGSEKLRGAGDLGMLQLITRFDGKKGTRLTWMHHGIGHEEYHRGQIALYARIAGRTPALTKLIYGE